MNIATPVLHGCCEHQFEPEHLHPIVSQLFKPSAWTASMAAPAPMKA